MPKKLYYCVRELFLRPKNVLTFLDESKAIGQIDNGRESSGLDHWRRNGRTKTVGNNNNNIVINCELVKPNASLHLNSKFLLKHRRSLL